jgi:hypothetical protein
MLSVVSTNKKHDKILLYLSHYSLIYAKEIVSNSNKNTSNSSISTNGQGVSFWSSISGINEIILGSNVDDPTSSKKNRFSLMSRASLRLLSPISSKSASNSPTNTENTSISPKASLEISKAKSTQNSPRNSFIPNRSVSPKFVIAEKSSLTPKSTFQNFRNSMNFSIFKKKKDSLTLLVRSHSDNIVRILKDVDKRFLFKEYSKKEFSEENVNFWEDVQIFKSLEDLEMKLDKMEEIQKNYLTKGEKYEININLDLLEVVKEKIFQNLQKNEIEDNELFDSILNDLVGGILNDTFSRFRFHESYLNLKLKDAQ